MTISRLTAYHADLWPRWTFFIRQSWFPHGFHELGTTTCFCQLLSFRFHNNPASAMPLRLLVDDVIERLRNSWRGEQRLTAAELLHAHPDLNNDSAAAVDVIYTEILLREQHGESPSETEYLDQFPEFHDEIARQFQLHRALRDFSSFARGGTVEGAKTLSESPTMSLPSSVLQMPGFDLQSIVGRGGSGVVYRAYDIELKRTVAIKFLQTGGAEGDRQLMREAEAAAALRHPNIVQVHQIGNSAGTPFLVMDFIDGESLSARLRRGPLPVDQAVSLLIEIANAIQFAHNHGIIHRDIKPGNVLLDQFEIPHVCDFGLARKFGSEFTLHATGDVVGTPAYMSPEQARGKTVTTAADVYSLGALLYHCLTGRPPFQATTPWEVVNQVMTDDPVAAIHLNRTIPSDLSVVCSTALHKVASRRIDSAGEFAAELVRIRDGQPIRSRPVGLLEHISKFCRRNPALTSLLGVSVAALVTVTIVSVISQQRVSNALTDAKAAYNQASTQRDVAFSAMQNLLHEVYGNLEKHEASVEARAELLNSAINGLQKIIHTGDSDPRLLVTMAEARTRFGFILSQQGRNEESSKQYEIATSITSRLTSKEARIAHATAKSLHSRQFLRMGDVENSHKVAQSAVDDFMLMLQSEPQSPALQSKAAAAHQNLGHSLLAVEQSQEGRDQLYTAQELLHELCAKESMDTKLANQLIDVNMSIANYHFGIAEVGEAEVALQEAMELIEANESGIETDTQLYRDYLWCCLLSARAKFGRMEYKNSIAALRTAEEGYQRLINVEPLRPSFPLKQGVVKDLLARCELALGNLTQSEQHVFSAINHFEKAMERGG